MMLGMRKGRVLFIRARGQMNEQRALEHQTPSTSLGRTSTEGGPPPRNGRATLCVVLPNNGRSSLNRVCSVSSFIQAGQYIVHCE